MCVYTVYAWLTGYPLAPSPSVCTNAGAIAKVITLSVAGAQIVDVCASGDQFILQETDQVFKNKKDIKKGEHACRGNGSFSVAYCCFVSFFVDVVCVHDKALRIAFP